MENFKSRITLKIIEKKRREQAIKGFAIASLMASTLIFSGYKTAPHQELVSETYVVQEGDTLWDISERYMQKNTGGRRYILEFQSGIEELNPWLVERHKQLKAGDKLRINYFVATKGGAENE